MAIKIQKSTKWYKVYTELANLLIDFSNKNDKPGEFLFKLCIEDYKFVDENNWIDKFKKDFNVQSIDPFHVFASFGGNRNSTETRIRKINILLRILGGKKSFQNIDFIGCPFPAIIKIVGARDLEAQDEIWSFFNRVYAKGRSGLRSKDFESYKFWFGINFSSMTIFLFWIRSTNFLPVDKNTSEFLVGSGIIEKPLEGYRDYMKVLRGIDKFNPITNTKFGVSGLFREIAFMSYKDRRKDYSNYEMSSHFQNWFKTEGSLFEGKNVDTSKKISDKEEIHGKDDIIKLPKSSNIGFKLVAIRPLTGCLKKYHTVLNLDKLYYFEKSFLIEGEIVHFNPEKNVTIFNQKIGENAELGVNVTAVVGKNGSGKSTLIELLYKIVNNIAFVNKQALKTKELKKIEGLSAELYYVINGKLFKITVNDTDIKVDSFLYYSNKFHLDKEADIEFNKSFFNSFFYSICVNYSHYALNSLSVGEWVNGMFHKNDAYQTPMVINPMRTEGIININSENDLVKTRLLVNLLSPLSDEKNLGFRRITKKLTAYKIHLDFDSRKGNVLYKEYLDSKENIVYIKELKTHKTTIFNKLKKIFNLPENIQSISDKTFEANKRYIVSKLVRIATTYGHYNKYFDKKTKSFDIDILDDFLIKLKDDNSHITHKLKQSINFWKYPKLWEYKTTSEYKIQEASDNIQIYQSIENSYLVVEFLPPPIFKPTIILIDEEEKNEDEKESDFEDLSSGEKQFTHSISSILYHLRNLDSVQSKFGLVAYKNVMLILDEIELYYHPEMQQQFLSKLLSYIKHMELTNISDINICLLTHSPYILSDIPSNNILKLEDGNIIDLEFETFGANIHDLLADSFFLENGFIGEYAREKIQKLIINITKADNHNDEINKREVWRIIELIGEPLIKQKLRDMYYAKYDDGEKQQEINDLKTRLKNLTE